MAFERACAAMVLFCSAVLALTDLLWRWSPTARWFHWTLGWVVTRYVGMAAATLLAIDVFWVT